MKIPLLHSLRRCLISLVAMMLVLAFVRQAGAQDERSQEYKFKAAYLFNFLHFIDWPESAFPGKSSSLIIGILNQDEFAKVVEQLVEGESINGRRIAVRRVHDLKHIKECHMFFIPKSEESTIPLVIAQLDSLNVLTVSEVKGFAEQGGAVNFFVQDNKLRFEINTDVLKKSNLGASSRLLRLARIVNGPN